MKTRDTPKARIRMITQATIALAAMTFLVPSCATNGGGTSGGAGPGLARPPEVVGGAEFAPTAVTPHVGGDLLIGSVVTEKGGPIAVPSDSLWSLDGPLSGSAYTLTSLGPVIHGECRLIPKAMILSDSGGVTISGVGLRKENGSFFMELAPGTREVCLLLSDPPPETARRFSFERPVVARTAAPEVGRDPTGRPPGSDVWSRSFPGDGPVPARIRNASDNDLTVRVRNARDQVIAQVKLPAAGSANIRLERGTLTTQLRLERSGQVSYYRGPGIEVPPTASKLDLTLQAASFSNLAPIDASEFSR